MRFLGSVVKSVAFYILVGVIFMFTTDLAVGVFFATKEQCRQTLDSREASLAFLGVAVGCALRGELPSYMTKGEAK